MKRFLKTGYLFLLAFSLLGLASCSCGDREDRLAELRKGYGVEVDAREAVAAAAAEAIAQRSPGAQLYHDKTCHTCHGEDGIKALLPNYPVIARQGQKYALQQMKDIQSGSRTNGQSAAMKAVIANVTEEELILLAEYIATELGGDAPIGTGVVDEESAGANLFKTKTCTACHGKDAVSPILPDYPKIAGHTVEYALQQMQDIKNGTRANSMAVLGMKGVMHLVTEEEMAQLAEYISTMPR